MAKKLKDTEFYKRMLEAKERKRVALEQKRLHDEFGDVPLPPQIVIKPLAEQKMDEAFGLLQAKLRAANPTPADKMAEAFKHLQEEANKQQ